MWFKLFLGGTAVLTLISHGAAAQDAATTLDRTQLPIAQPARPT
jgi:hypothetical protein